jgi:hypothetical protein
MMMRLSENLGKSLRFDSLIKDFASEAAKGEPAKRLWASQHLNIEIGLGLRSDGWAGAPIWQRGIEPGLALDRMVAGSIHLDPGIVTVTIEELRMD